MVEAGGQGRWGGAQVLESRVDHSRVVLLLRRDGHLPLVKDYLLSVQKTNLAAVNEAVNELLVEEDNFEVTASPSAKSGTCLHQITMRSVQPQLILVTVFAVRVICRHACAPELEGVTLQALRESVTTYDNFDQLALAAKLEKHDLMEFRRIAALIYKKNLRWRKAVDLAKTDNLFKARSPPLG